jgi:hypothetical protein
LTKNFKRILVLFIKKILKNMGRGSRNRRSRIRKKPIPNPGVKKRHQIRNPDPPDCLNPCHRARIISPLPLRVAKTGRNHLNEEFTPLLRVLPTGIGERF